MSSASDGPIYFLKFAVNKIMQEILQHLILFAADKLYRHAGFIFFQDLQYGHNAKGAILPRVPQITTVWLWVTDRQTHLTWNQ